MNPGRQPVVAPASQQVLAPLSAGRLLVIGGILLIASGLVFGEIFAVFALRPNAGRIGGELLEATRAVTAGNAAAVGGHFSRVGGLLENRGTKVDTHVHVIDFGYLALLLALFQPYIALPEQRRKRLAQVFLAGAVLLPVCVFLIHYIGLTYSPLESIGWASIFADLGGLMVLIAAAGMAWGLWKYLGGSRTQSSDPDLLADRSWCGRVLLSGGTLLVLTGFAYGAWYAGADLYRLEHRETAVLTAMLDGAVAGNAGPAVNDYGALQADKAVKIAAHSHIIEFGLLALLLALVQPYVYLSERWRRRWVAVLLVGSLVLPVFVLAELRWGLVAGGIADFGGLLVILALCGMLAGVLRFTGALDAAGERLH